MPYTDFTDVIQDDADAIRYIDGSTASIVFADMPNRILAINGLKFGSTDSSRSWVGKFLPYITGSEYITDMSYMFYFGKMVGNPDFSNFSTVSATNMSNMFQSCDATTLDLSSFDTSNVTNLYCMFESCLATTIDVSSFDTSNVTNMYRMFANSNSTTLDLSSFDTSSVTTMHGMFEGCNSTTLDLSSFNTSNVTDMQYMFSSCRNAIATLDLSSFDTSNVTDMHGMFSNSIVYAGIDLDLSTFDVSNVTNMSDMFGCSRNTLAASSIIDLSNWDTSSAINMSAMFANLRGKIWLPSTFVATSVVDANKKPFYSISDDNTDLQIYTDATDAETQGWGTVDASKYHIHYNSTYQDFINA